MARLCGGAVKRGHGSINRSAPMLDAIFVLTTLAFFGLGALFIDACERI